MTSIEKEDPGAVPLPRYWVHEKEVKKKLDKSDRRQTSWTNQPTLDILAELAHSSLSAISLGRPTNEQESPQ